MSDGRAYTEAQKRAVIERILAAWLRKPEMRLGQLLHVAAEAAGMDDAFYIEDERLAEIVERFAEKE